MAKQSPHKRWKGCQLCKPWKFRDDGQAHRQPTPVVRLAGRDRRLRRHEAQDGWGTGDPGDDQDWYWTPEWQAGEREAELAYAAGDYQSFDSPEELLAWFREAAD
jgi:hypothetical protein